jgi:hypothetical protein
LKPFWPLLLWQEPFQLRPAAFLSDEGDTLQSRQGHHVLMYAYRYVASLFMLRIGIPYSSSYSSSFLGF